MGSRGWQFCVALLQFIEDRRTDGQLQLTKETLADFVEITTAVINEGRRFIQ